jgi:hypothetical protein
MYVVLHYYFILVLCEAYLYITVHSPGKVCTWRCTPHTYSYGRTCKLIYTTCVKAVGYRRCGQRYTQVCKLPADVRGIHIV